MCKRSDGETREEQSFFLSCHFQCFLHLMADTGIQIEQTLRPQGGQQSCEDEDTNDAEKRRVRFDGRSIAACL